MDKRVLGAVIAATTWLATACDNQSPDTPTAAPPDPAAVTVAAATSEPAASNNTAFPSEVYRGDTHVHTAYSMDAGLFGNRLPPEDAYRFAKGERVTSSTGVTAQLEQPLDFLVVSDHSDNLGFFPKLVADDPTFLATADDIAAVGYEKGVPMGGDLSAAAAGATPSFLIFALRDTAGRTPGIDGKLHALRSRPRAD